jgi:hypothetical protein
MKNLSRSLSGASDPVPASLPSEDAATRHSMNVVANSATLVRLYARSVAQDAAISKFNELNNA